jgi:hypothetical protein
MQSPILGMAEAHGMMQWQDGAVDGSVSPGKGGGAGVVRGGKGKGN